VRTRQLCAAALALGACLYAGSAGADSVDEAEMRATGMAYQAAMKCYVTLAYASDQRRKAGDNGKSALYEAKARQSFDMAFRAGEKTGLNDDRINRDIDFVQKTELPKLIQDEKYFLATAAMCKAAGFL
jgi:hypothetical protein